MLEVNRKELDKFIASLDGMFNATAEVLEEYEKEKELLLQRAKKLENTIDELQTNLINTQNKIDTTADPTTYIALSKKVKSLNEEIQIIEGLQEQLQGDFKALKQKYIHPIRNAYSSDMTAKNGFSVNDEVDRIIYQFIKAIADVAVKVREEDYMVIDSIRDEFLDDRELMAENKAFMRQFGLERTQLSYSSVTNNILTKNNINLACSGSVPAEIREVK